MTPCAGFQASSALRAFARCAAAFCVCSGEQKPGARPGVRVSYSNGWSPSLHVLTPIVMTLLYTHDEWVDA